MKISFMQAGQGLIRVYEAGKATRWTIHNHKGRWQLSRPACPKVPSIQYPDDLARLIHHPNQLADTVAIMINRHESGQGWTDWIK